MIGKYKNIYDLLNILETIYLKQYPATMQDIKHGLKTDLKDCINEHNLKYLDIENTNGKEEIK